MTHKRYNVRAPFSPKALHHDMELHRDLRNEVVKTGELLKSIGDIAVRFRSLKASYEVLREHELMNERLKDIIDQWNEVVGN